MKKLFLILLISINIFAWEINTHRAIDRTALSNVPNLNTFIDDTRISNEDYHSEIFEDYEMTYFQYIKDGERNGLSELGQIFTEYNYKSLLEAGSILEDAQWPHWGWLDDNENWPFSDMDRGHGRFTNHFYNVQSHFVNSSNALTWVRGGGANKYGYNDAIEYFAKGFSKESKSERRKYQAKMFVSVGHMMHMLNDMNVPAHVRGDLHPFYEPLELWAKGGENADQNTGFYIKGNAFAGNLSPSAGTVTPQINLNQFMTSEASYTSYNFFSDDTIFKYEYPKKEDTYEDENSWISPTVEKVYIKDKTTNEKLAIRVNSYLMVGLNKIYVGKDLSMVMGSTTVLDNDFSIIENQAKALFPRAIANASGFVNYFFRGRLETASSLCGGLEVKNASEPEYVASSDALIFKKGGVFKVYADDADGNRIYLTEQTLTDDLPVDGTVYIDGVTQAYTSAFGTSSGSAEVIVVYSGNIGREGGVAVSRATIDPGAVPTEVPTATAGAVEVTLSWSEGGNNFDLDLAMPSSVKDIQSCMREHAYVGSEYDIYPGKYAVNVNYAGGAYRNDTYFLSIKTPGETKLLKFDTNSSGFDPGHVADIVVKYVDNKPVLSLDLTIPPALVISTVGEGGGEDILGDDDGIITRTRYSSPTTSVCSPALSCGCMPCEYKIILYLGQVIKGPLSGADIALFDAAGYRTGTPLYSGQTGEGTDLYTAGLLNLPQTLIDNLDDDGLYILQVSGGTDIDRNDDMVADSVFTQNNATLHAILTGADLKAIKPKVSILTEIAYQLVHESIIAGEDTQNILDALDEVATRLLSTKIYPATADPLGHVDLAEWLPTIDKDILVTDYKTRILPIIDKLQAKADIYQDAYDVVYYPDGVLPIIKSTRFDVPENTPTGTVIGQINILSEGQSAITGMTLSGEGNASFSIDTTGTVTLLQPLDFEKNQFYQLYVRAQNDRGSGRPTALYVRVGDVLDAPVITGFSAPIVYSASPIGTAVGKVSFNEGNDTVTAITLGGEDSGYFQVDLSGTVTVVKALENYLIKKAYNFTMTVSNTLGDSRPASIILNISNGHELPVLEGFDVNVTENTSAGSVIGQVTITSEGLSPITSFTLSGSDDFTINSQGEITVSENGQLDYETQISHHFTVSAHNSYGDGEEVIVTVNIDNLLDAPPTVYPASMQIDENSPTGTSVGSLTLDQGEAAVDAIEISGEGHELFTADPDGTVRVTGGLDYESNTSYALTFSAVSALGKSNTATLSVGINNVPEVAPTLQASTVSRHFKEFSIGLTLDNLLVDAGDTPVQSVTLQPDSPFGVHNDGSLYLASAFTGETNEFNLTAEAINSFGASNSVNVAIHVDAQPILSATRLTVDENASAGTALGKIGIVSEGMVPIESFSADSALFTIDSDGTVRVAQGTELDYETLTGYGLNVTAANRFGNSNTVALNISVNNIPETAPTVRDINITINRDTPVGTLLGNILYNKGDTPISEFILAESSPFTIDLAGNISLAETLMGDDTESYQLSARAKNAYGWSDFSNINIKVHSLLVMLNNTTLTTFDTTSDGTVIGQINMAPNGNTIKSVTLWGTGHEDFEVDLNGTVRVASGVTLDAERQQYYTLQVEVNEIYNAKLNIEVLDRIIATIDTPGYANNVALSVDDTKVYVADGRAGLQVIDVTDSNGSSVIGSIVTTGYVANIVLSADGEKALISDGNAGLIVIDITEPAMPTVLGSDNTMNPKGFTFSSDNTKAYVADWDSGIQIIDITDPTMPIILGSVDTPGYANDVVYSANSMKAYIADRTSGLQIIDVSDPTVPTIIGSVDTPDYANSVTHSLDDKVAYVANGSYGLRIIDITDPTSPSIIGSVDTPSYAGNIVLSADNTKAYIADGSSGLQIIDVSDPTLPAILGSINTPEYAADVALSSDESIAYVADGSTGLLIVDIRGFEVPEKIPSIIGFSSILEANSTIGTYINSIKIFYTGAGGLTSLELTGDGAEDFEIAMNGDISLKNALNYTTRSIYNLVAMATNAVGSRSVNLTIRLHAMPELEDFTGEVNSMSKESTYVGQIDMWLDDNTTVTDITLFGEGAENFTLDTNGKIYVAAGAKLLHSRIPEYNLTAIATNSYGNSNEADVLIKVSPITGFINLPGGLEAVAVSKDGMKVYVMNGSSGLQIIDVADPTEPYLIGSVETPGYPYDVVLTADGTKAYIANGNAGMLIIDLSNPSVPSIIGSFATPGTAYGIVLSSDDTKAYIADKDSGLQIIDITDPISPSIIGSVEMTEYAHGVSLSPDGTKAYVVDYHGYVQIIDINDSAAPTLISLAEMPSFAMDVTLSSDNTRAYATDFYNGIQIIDVSDPSAPFIVGSAEMPGHSYGITLSSDGMKAFTTDSSSGLQIIDITTPSAPFILGSINTPPYGAYDVALAPDGTKAYVVDGNSSLQVIDLTGIQ